MINRSIQTVLLLIGLVMLGFFLFVASSDSISSAHPTIEYKDFVSILLTALAVMIAIAAVIAALAAIWGFAVLREEASKSAAEAARDETRKIIPRLVKEAMDFAKAASESRGDEVADEYGKEVGDDGTR
jgi:uncharacterized membrane protein YcjF (UPF0283 family)